MNIQLAQQIQAAREHDDRVEVARLRSEVPLEERNRLDGGGYTIAAGRGNPIPPTQLVGTSHNLPHARTQTGPGPSLFMHPSLLRALRAEAEFDGRETGGFLIGSSDSAGVEILDFRKAINEDSNTWRSMELDPQHGIAILTDLPSDRTVVGEYHNHPTGFGTAASQQDIKGSAGLCEKFRRDHWVLLVVNDPDDPRAVRADVSAYVVRPDGNYDVTEITETRSL